MKSNMKPIMGICAQKYKDLFDEKKQTTAVRWLHVVLSVRRLHRKR